MAVDLTSNPWIVPSADASATPLTTNNVHVKGIRWTGATTAGHTATITDAAGKVKWTSVASGANYVESDLIEGPSGAGWAGVVVPTLGSGTLYIEYE